MKYQHKITKVHWLLAFMVVEALKNWTGENNFAFLKGADGMGQVAIVLNADYDLTPRTAKKYEAFAVGVTYGINQERLRVQRLEKNLVS